MKNIIYIFVLLILTTHTYGQDTTGSTVQRIVLVNNAIEQAMLDKNVAALDSLFGYDLLFYHGGGNVDNKTSYIARVPKSNYASRMTDSTKVELHDNVALVTGRVIVHNGGDKPKSPYGIRYVRLYALRYNNWILISHRTTQKWDEKQ